MFHKILIRFYFQQRERLSTNVFINIQVVWRFTHLRILLLLYAILPFIKIKFLHIATPYF